MYLYDAVADAEERAAPEMIVGIEALAIDIIFPGLTTSSAEIRHKTAALKLRRPRHSGVIENRRSDVDQSGSLLESRGKNSGARPVHQERYPQRALIRKVAVCALAMVPEPFAMIGRKDDQRSFQYAFAGKVVPEFPNHAIFVFQYGIVTQASGTAWNVIRRVQVVKVQKQKKRLLQVLPQPGGRGLQTSPPGLFTFPGSVVSD